MCSSAFDLIHVDVWGPYSIPSHDGYKYFFTIMDDTTRLVWAFLISLNLKLDLSLSPFLK